MILTTMWVDLDSKEQPNITRAYHFSLFVFIFWIGYLPYYFIKTRGLMGLLPLISLFILFNFGYIDAMELLLSKLKKARVVPKGVPKGVGSLIISNFLACMVFGSHTQ